MTVITPCPLPPYTPRSVHFSPSVISRSGGGDSFVLGVQSKHLRSTKLSDLVFRADGAAPSSRRAMVKVRPSVLNLLQAEHLSYEIEDTIENALTNRPSSAALATCR